MAAPRPPEDPLHPLPIEGQGLSGGNHHVAPPRYLAKNTRSYIASNTGFWRSTSVGCAMSNVTSGG